MVHSDGTPENQQDQPPHLVFLEKKKKKLNLHSINTCVDVYVIFFVNYLLFLGKSLAFLDVLRIGSSKQLWAAVVIY